MKKIFVLICLFSSMASEAQSSYPTLILPGDYADPTIVRDGKDYYMTHSPFFYIPGFLIWHSTDLEHWQPISRALTGAVKGLPMAPDLVKIRDTFYLYFPSAKTNWVMWSTNIRGPWSAPVDLNIAKIDPGHAVGEDGHRYLFVSGGGMARLTANGLAAISSDIIHVYDGWDYPKEWVTECKCLESPKLLKHGEYFYMISAEGGTAGPATSHMVIAARSKSILGPWENSPYNPLVHTYDSADAWWSKGHGTLIDDVNGNWWMVYHAYAKGYHTLGRQTLLEPVEWTPDGWFKMGSSFERPRLKSTITTTGFNLSDNFQTKKPGLQWTSWKKYDSTAATISSKQLLLRGKGSSVADAELLLTTAQDSSYEVEVTIQSPAKGTGGLVLFYNERAYAGITVDAKGIHVFDTTRKDDNITMARSTTWTLKIRNHQNKCNFYASKDGKKWTLLKEAVDVSGLHHNNYRNFLALRIGLVAIGEETIRFSKFIYRTLDQPR